MKEQPKASGNYITVAWLVILAALVYGSALAGVQLWLGPIIAENKLNETYDQIPNIVPGADQDVTKAVNLEQPLDVTTASGSPVPVFKAMDADSKLIGWVVSATGQGFAGPIDVLIGFDAELSKVTGLFVLGQTETPGLGDFITGEEFRHRFADQSTDAPLTVVVGSADAPGQIQALTGATVSSQAVTDIVNSTVENVRQSILDQVK